jgi:hypothetical protein
MFSSQLFTQQVIIYHTDFGVISILIRYVYEIGRSEASENKNAIKIGNNSK